MMKKLSSILLLVFFLIANSGMAVNLHWCGGKLSSLDLNSIEKSNCGCGKKAMKSNCCKDSNLLLKASDEFSKAPNSSVLKQSIGIVVFISLFYSHITPSGVISQHHADFEIPPPLIPKEPLFISAWSFLI